MRKIFLCIVVCLTVFSETLVAQTYNMSTTTVNTCGGTFYDAGGTGNYNNSESYTMTFCSSVAGNQVQVSFSSFASENSYDKLLVYDGTGTGGTLLGTMTGTAVVMPANYISTSGCLTFVWTSDGSTTNTGWVASISCVAPTLMSNGSITSCTGLFYDSGNQSSNYSNNENYTMTFCSPTAGNIMKFVFSVFNTQNGSDILTIYDGPNTSSPVIGTYSGTTSPGTIYSTDECITFVFTSNNSNNNDGWAATYSCIPPPASNSCAGADPFCTGSTYNFPAGVNAGSGETGPNYGCLYSEPNPVWYYLKIATPGDIMISMSSSASVDIDFACWGPFTSPTTPCTAQLTATGTSWSSDNPHGSYPYPYGNLVDCSYNSAASEICYIPNGVVGQYYLLMITNFSNQVTNIIFSQTSGSGATDCSIVAPPVTNNGPVCAGQTIQLHVSNPVTGATYAWTGPNSFSSNLMEPTITNASTANSGTYNLVITVGGVSSAPVSTTVVVNPNPVVTPSASPATICNGASSSLSATSSVTGSTYTWNPGSLSGSPVSVSPTTNTTYTVTASASGCTGTSTVTVTVTVNSNITPTFTQLGPYCQGSSPAALPATSGNSINGTWSPASISTATAGNTVYTFTPAAGQCAGTNTMTVTVNPLIAPTFSTIGPFCQGSVASALPGTSTNSITGTWSPAVISTSSAGSTNYTFTPGGTFCASVQTVSITINPQPVVNPLSNITLCNGAPIPASVFASTPAGATFTWANSNPGIGLAASGSGNTGSVTATNAGSSPASGTLTVTPTLAGCSGTSSSYTITVNPTPVVNPVSNISVCHNGSVSAINFSGAVSGTTYSWTNSNTSIGLAASGTGNITAFTATNTGSSPVTATITVTPSANSCTGTAITFTITVNPLPVINFPALSSLCLGGSSLNLNSATPAGGTYSGTGVSGNTFNPAVAGAGSFVITYNYTDANSCSSSATQNITVYNGPTANFGISPSPGCAQQAVTASYSGTGGSGCNYTWNFAGGSATPGTGAGPQQITFSTPGTYTITLTTSENGCSSAPYTQTVTIGLVTPTTAITHIISCNGGSDGQLTASPTGGAGPYTYVWSTSPSQITQTATNIAIGTYTVTVTDAAGCTGTSSVSITEPAEMNASITDSTMVVCYGQNTGSATVTAYGGTQPYQYHWASNTSTLNTANAYEAGNYSVTVNDNNGCSVVVPFSISQNPQMLLSLIPVNVGCENACDGEAALVISGGVAPYTYLWSPGGSTNLGITELCPGTYTVSVTDAANCVITDNTVINTNTFLTSFINVQPQSGIAPVEVTFNYSGTGATIFAWDFGDGSTSTATSPSHIYAEPGTYTVNVVMSSGAPDYCMDSMKMEVTVYPPSTVTIPNVFTPNTDGHNDSFTVQSEGLDTESMIIYNRWGRKVWEWNEVHGSWDGQVNSGGEASAGEYYYIFTAKGYDQKVYESNGSVSLLR
jgi:gliding motility-associated-like protein